MLDLSIIIFALSFITICVIVTLQWSKLKNTNGFEKVFPSKDLTYENFQIVNSKLKRSWLIFIHSVAIIATKIWVRITHYISAFFRKGFKKVEDRLIKIEKKNSEEGVASQSLFLTTMKTYKREIRKMKKSSEDEMPRPRDAAPLDTNEEKDTIG